MEARTATKTENVMRSLRIGKVVLNIGCGTTMPVENAKKILEMITGSKVVIIKSKRRSTFNVPKNTPIGCKVTIRKNMEGFIKRMLEARENQLNASSFDDNGNLAFGIREYIDIPDIQYDPKIKISGMDVCVSIERPGYSTKRKRISHKVGKRHLVTKEESINFIKEKFGVRVE